MTTEHIKPKQLPKTKNKTYRSQPKTKYVTRERKTVVTRYPIGSVGTSYESGLVSTHSYEVERNFNIHEAFAEFISNLVPTVRNPDQVTYQTLGAGDTGYRMWWVNDEDRGLVQIDLGCKLAIGFVYDPEDPSKDPEVFRMDYPGFPEQIFSLLPIDVIGGESL